MSIPRSSLSFEEQLSGIVRQLKRGVNLLYAFSFVLIVTGYLMMLGDINNLKEKLYSDELSKTKIKYVQNKIFLTIHDTTYLKLHDTIYIEKISSIRKRHTFILRVTEETVVNYGDGSVGFVEHGRSIIMDTASGKIFKNAPYIHPNKKANSHFGDNENVVVFERFNRRITINRCSGAILDNVPIRSKPFHVVVHRGVETSDTSVKAGDTDE